MEWESEGIFYPSRNAAKKWQRESVFMDVNGLVIFYFVCCWHFVSGLIVLYKFKHLDVCPESRTIIGPSRNVIWPALIRWVLGAD